jgi:hypothetical protein
MAAKKSAASAAKTTFQPSISDLPPGSGTARVSTRFIGIYGPPKSRKTTACAYLPMGRTKWLVSDSNCAATLEALDRTPPPEDFYEMKSMEQAVELLKKLLEIADTNGKEALGIDFLVVDSLTQFFEWAQRAVAEKTGQRFLGQSKGWDSNGYQEFNATFLEFLDLLASASRYVTVICIAHSKELHEKQKKGEFGGLNLSGTMGIALGRKCNWLLLKTMEVLADDGQIQEDDMSVKTTDPEGNVVFERSCLLTQSTIDGYTASANLKLSNRTRTRWPGDLRVLLRAENLLPTEEES